MSVKRRKATYHYFEPKATRAIHSVHGKEWVNKDLARMLAEVYDDGYRRGKKDRSLEIKMILEDCTK